MKIITNKKILIKDHPIAIIFGIFGVSIVCTFFLNTISHDKNFIVTFEQTIFVILSAVIFVFNEAIIGYTTISKIRNKINKFQQNEIKRKVLINVGISSVETENNYSEFFRNTEEEIFYFQKRISKFKRHSFFLYLCFAIIGLSIILIYLTDFNNKSYSIPYISFDTNKIIVALVIAQILSIFIWIISAYQAEKQKYEILNYFEIENISTKMKDYLQQINTKSIDMSINGYAS